MASELTSSPDEELERRYLGEPVHRRPALAILAALVCPGLGLAYLGRPMAGMFVNALLIGLWVAFLLGWMVRPFSPLVPLLVLSLASLLLWLMVVLDVARWSFERGRDYVARDVNHPLVYTGVALFSFWLPLYSVFVTVPDRLFFVATVSSTDMYPTLVEGDHVVVDRCLSAPCTLNVGDVVAYRDPRTSERRFGRLVGLPDQHVTLEEGQIYVDAQPCAQVRLTGSSLDGVERMSGSASTSRVLIEESCGDNSWMAAMPRTAVWGEATISEPGEGVYILNDDRARMEDSRTIGRVPIAALQGRVTWVAWTTSGSEAQNSFAANVRAIVRGLVVSPDNADVVERRFGRRVLLARMP
jgi:signal peptidase I